MGEQYTSILKVLPLLHVNDPIERVIRFSFTEILKVGLQTLEYDPCTYSPNYIEFGFQEASNVKLGDIISIFINVGACCSVCMTQ